MRVSSLRRSTSLTTAAIRAGPGAGSRNNSVNTARTWGTVTAWEPPRRVAFTWHPGQPAERAQQIDVRFTPEGTGTRLELVHEGWESSGTMAARVRRGYGVGWAYVLRLWAGRRSSIVVWGMDGLLWALGPLQRRFARRVEAAAEHAATAAPSR